MLHHCESHNMAYKMQHPGVVAEYQYLMMAKPCQLVHKATGIVHLNIIIW